MKQLSNVMFVDGSLCGVRVLVGHLELVSQLLNKVLEGMGGLWGESLDWDGIQ